MKKSLANCWDGRELALRMEGRNGRLGRSQERRQRVGDVGSLRGLSFFPGEPDRFPLACRSFSRHVDHDWSAAAVWSIKK